MEINYNKIKQSLGTFTNAYGLNAKSDKLINFLSKINTEIKYVGVLLRDPFTKEEFIQCRFSIHGDYANQMIWVPINNKKLEVIPLFERYTGTDVKSISWKKFNSAVSNENFDFIEKNGFWLMANRSFRKNGIIEKFNKKTGKGYIRRSRGGIHFDSKWCNFKKIIESQEVSFLPIISRKGLNAMAVESVTTFLYD